MVGAARTSADHLLQRLFRDEGLPIPLGLQLEQPRVAAALGDEFVVRRVADLTLKGYDASIAAFEVLAAAVTEDETVAG